MKKVLALLMILLPFTVQAQSIRGTVCMQNDKAPAQFASVGLVHLPDSAIVTGVITLTDGGYSFDGIKPGNYCVKVSFLGYKIAIKELMLSDNASLQVDTIFLTETATSLDEVTIVGEKLKGKELVDRTTYSIPPLVAKTSTNGYELLKKIPQVNVDFQNNVTLNGSSNFIIQVDGRQRDKEFLAKLLPSDIESVEVISNPSGKYEGNIDGVINIILKKEARYGVNGNLGFNIKPINKLTYTATGSIDYSMGKITFYATAYTGSQNLHIRGDTYYDYQMLDSTSNMYGTGEIKVDYSSVNAGFDYYINDKNNLSFNVNYKPISQDIDLLSNGILSKNDQPLSEMLTLTDNSLKSNETTFSLFYKKGFAKPVQEFTTEVSYYMFNSTDGNGFSNRFMPVDIDSTLYKYERFEKNINDRDYFSGKFNYVHPLGMNTKIEAGYQVYYQNLNYDFRINNTQSDNLFEYSEFRNSAYAGVVFNLKKFGFQTTLRIENSHINADSVSEPDYTCFLPSVNFQYKLSASHNLKLTYNRRINRPGIYDMNPNYRIGQNYDLSQGNPDLKPDYRDRFQLTYTWNFGSNYFSPNIYYEALSDKIGMRYIRVNSPVDSNALTSFSKPFNLLSGYEYGGGVNAMLWFFNINARIYKGYFRSYTAPDFSIPSRDYFSYSVTSYAFGQLDKAKKTTAFAFINYNGVNVDAQSKTYNLTFYGAGVQKQMKNHNLGFVWVLPFSSDVELSRTETETPFYNIENIIGFDVSWYIQFMYSYKFNKGKNVKKVGHKIEVESDSKSNQIGM